MYLEIPIIVWDVWVIIVDRKLYTFIIFFMVNNLY